ncbi:MAG TPA: SHOCT domain-containing protein [Nitrososphaeraceae archaeon]
MAWRVARRRGIAGGLVVGGVTGAVVASHSAKKQYEKMAQQQQISQAQAQAAQATQAAQAAQAGQQQGSGQGKKDIYQELEKLAGLKQQGIITEEEFQQMKSRLLSSS